MRRVTDPDEAARLRARMREQLVECARAVDFPVYAGAGTVVMTGYSGSATEGARYVTTTVGEPLADGPDGVLVEVWTDRAPKARDVVFELNNFCRRWRLPGDDRNTSDTGDTSDTEDLADPGSQDVRTATVRIDGTDYETRVRHRDGMLAFQVPVGDLTVTAVSGHPRPPPLYPVADLPACAERNEDWTTRWATRYRTLRPPVPPPELDPAPGARAHRVLIDFVLTSRPRDPRWAAMWDRAAAHQHELTGQDERTATDEVHAMVNEVTALAERLPAWADVRDRVIDQCVRHTTGERVETAAQQRLWRTFFATAWSRDEVDARRRWLAGWEQWLAG